MEYCDQLRKEMSLQAEKGVSLSCWLWCPWHKGWSPRRWPGGVTGQSGPEKEEIAVFRILGDGHSQVKGRVLQREDMAQMWLGQFVTWDGRRECMRPQDWEQTCLEHTSEVVLKGSTVSLQSPVKGSTVCPWPSQPQASWAPLCPQKEHQGKRRKIAVFPHRVPK